MGALEIKIYAVGMLSTNCYFLIHKDTRQMVIVDPGADAERLKVKIEEQKLKPQAILLTHAHGDHILGVEYLKNAYQIPVYIHAVSYTHLDVYKRQGCISVDAFEGALDF